MALQQRKVLLFKDLGEEGVAEEASRPRARHDGKRAVVKVPSLLFDIELEDNATEDNQAEDDVQDVLRQLKALVQPWNVTELQLQQQVQRAYAEAAEEGIKLDAHQLAKRLYLPDFTFKVRTALGGGWSGDCLRQLRHFFLTCIAPGSPGGLSYVIDPSFREQFEIANPTAQYASILAELPREFIGTEDRISSIVTILSNEIKRSFQATGATLPPWRHPASMLSKWRPRRSEDITVNPSRAAHSARSVHPALLEDVKDGLAGDVHGKVDIAASSSLDDVAATIAEHGASRRIACGTRLHAAASSPAGEAPSSAGKRGRPAASGAAKCSSLLASKLRGVAAYNTRSATAAAAAVPGGLRGQS